MPALTFPNGRHSTDTTEWRLLLYVAGMTPAARRALANVERICERLVPGRYSLEVVDLIERPEQAAQDEIIAVPTLVRRLPGPVRKIIGDLSETDSVLAGLELEP